MKRVSTSMPPLDLDHVARRPTGFWLSAALFLLALGVAGDAIVQYRAVTEAVMERETRLAHETSPTFLERAMETPAPSPEEYVAVRTVLRRMVTPWDELFLAIESAQTEGTALLSIEPDAESGRMMLTGEARDYLSLLSYASALNSVKSLRDVHLARHEVRSSAPNRPIGFSISASWSSAR